MRTYAFLHNGDIEASEVQVSLEQVGFAGIAVQVLHYTEPKVIMVFTNQEFTQSERDAVARAISETASVDCTL